MDLQTRQTLLLMGNDTDLGYLLGRFAEQSAYHLTVATDKISIQDVTAANPTAIIFLSMDSLDKSQAFVAELTGLEVPIIVCSSITDQVRARELGADSCLLHPITYDGFQSAIATVTVPKV